MEGEVVRWKLTAKRMAEFFKARNIPYLVCNGYKYLFFPKIY